MTSPPQLIQRGLNTPISPVNGELKRVISTSNRNFVTVDSNITLTVTFKSLQFYLNAQNLGIELPWSKNMHKEFIEIEINNRLPVVNIKILGSKRDLVVLIRDNGNLSYIYVTSISQVQIQIDRRTKYMHVSCDAIEADIRTNLLSLTVASICYRFKHLLLHAANFADYGNYDPHHTHYSATVGFLDSAVIEAMV